MITTSLLLVIVWILAVSLVGMLPMSQHKRLGFPLLTISPFLLIYLGWEMGPFWAVVLFAAGLSIYRYPARYYGLKLWYKLSGKKAP